MISDEIKAIDKKYTKTAYVHPNVLSHKVWYVRATSCAKIAVNSERYTTLSSKMELCLNNIKMLKRTLILTSTTL